ncbi:MAG: PEP-utilizing enzyme [Alphaproteobacteria bacterium]
MNNLPNKIKNLNRSKKSFLVPKFLVFDVEMFEKNSDLVFKKVKTSFKSEKVAIRSSSSNEDNFSSNAGKYHSELNVNVKKKSIISATKKVINSYEPINRIKEKFFIQRMITDSKLNGVIFTREQNNGFPFTTINFTLGNKTNLITSGEQNGFVFKYINSYEPKTKKFGIDKIHYFIKKLKKCIRFNNLDIEFSISASGKINLLQVRELNVKKNNEDSKVLLSYKLLEKKLNKILNDNSFLKGKSTIYSTMTDWNPAEIIGTKPNNLSYSLYSELITDYVWSKSRAYFNYCDLGETPLMYNFLGTPFIDLRADFNSFLPNNLNENLKNKLVNFYLNKYKKKPDFYFDKVESELIIANVDFSTNKKIKIFKKNFNKNEIKIFIKELEKITNNSFEILKKSIEKYKKIEVLLNRIKYSKGNPINKIYNYINICKNYGTFPFANIARCAFISMNFLNSMVEDNIFTKNEKKLYLNSLRTTTSRMLNELNKKSKKAFLKKFGHLRPSTYDINSLSYNENYNSYFNKTNTNNLVKNKKFKFSSVQKEKIHKRLENLNLLITTDSFIKFLEQSIIHRENSKFFFTKSIELIFCEIKEIGRKFNIPKNDLCYIDIKVIKNLYNNFTVSEVKKTLNENIKENKLNFNFNKNLPLPNNIINKEDIYSIFETDQKPSFIGEKNIRGDVFPLYKKNFSKKMNNKIVCIKSADPGYDFIFTKNIKGLITEYGGPNSHMCIRCSELGIPAVIGVGSNTYEKVINSKQITLDFFNKTITQ